jgi:hypothetical protein
LAFFKIGEWFNLIVYFKVDDEFYFDEEGWRGRVGLFAAKQYQNFMCWSSDIQDWGGYGVWEDVVCRFKVRN